MIIPVAAAIPTMEPTGFTIVGCFIARYAMMIAGNPIAIKIPANVTVKADVFMVAKAYNPNDNEIPKTTKVVALALLLVEIPPSKMPTAKKISPINMTSPLKACKPSMNVCAIPAYDKKTPAKPTAVSPIPGIMRSQLLIQDSW
jgi:hypothetical protein